MIVCSSSCERVKGQELVRGTTSIKGAQLFAFSALKRFQRDKTKGTADSQAMDCATVAASLGVVHLQRIAARGCGISTDFSGVARSISLCSYSMHFLGKRHSRLKERIKCAQSCFCLGPDNATAAEFDLSPNEKSFKYYVSGENAVEATERLLQNEDTATIFERNLDESTELVAAAALVENNETHVLDRMRHVFEFAGPALGIWLSGPIMSMIDTSVVGISSSVELAALGPGTVICDGLGYCFMFLSVATSNLIATSLANKDETEAANHLARLLFVALACGMAMLTVIKLSSKTLLRAFVGGNITIIPAAVLYVNIRAFAWPVVLVTMVAQSACLGMQDSMSPLKVLAVTSLINAVGDVLLCKFFHCGIAGAAWATMISQYVAGILMLISLRTKGYKPLALAIPSMKDFVQMIKIAAPVLMTMLSKVAFYTAIIYFTTSLGAVTLGAHQVMIGIYTLFSIWGEPLAQTAQSFMPELISGKSRNLKKARNLLQTLLLSGSVLGAGLAIGGSVIPLFFPQLFTNDSAIVAQMRGVTVPFFLSVALTPPTLSLEGTLLAARDFRYLGISMTTCFICGSILLMICHNLGFGLRSYWWTLVLFQLTRFIISLLRLNSTKSILNDKA